MDFEFYFTVESNSCRKDFRFDAHKPQSACVIGHSNQAQQIVERLIVQKNKEFNYVGSIVEKEFENMFSIKQN